MNNINQKIPEGWSVISLKNCVKIFGRIGYRGYTCEDIVKQGEGAITLSPSNIIDNKINYEDNTYISWYKYEESPEIKIKNGDIIFVKTGSSFGKSAIIRHLPEPATINPQLIVFKDFKGNKEYFAYLISSFNFQKKVHQTVVGGTIPTLSQEEIYKYSILLPSLPEQEKIAGILGTWDEAIEKLSSLIEQKKLLKKGLMQRLLTGKTRLNGFIQPWKEVKLGEIFNIKKGQGLSKDVLDSKGVYKCILYGELYTKYSEVIKNTISRTNKNEKITSNIGDILIPASTTTSGIDLANATALLESDVILGGDINILRSKKEISPVFFAYLLTHSYKFDIARLAQGITIVHLYAEFLKSMKVFVPTDITEQKAIADVLSTADDEIDLLNKKLEALKEQKKGLMKQLLTGQIRVKVN